MFTDEHRALGDVRNASERLELGLSAASNAGADNLLFKALAQLLRGDEARARAFVGRALALPFDAFEEHQPAPWSAHMMLLISISSDVKSGAPDDPAWLDRAEAVLENSGPYAAAEVRLCLRGFVSEAYAFPPAVKARLTTLTEGVPADAEPLAGVAEDEATRTDAIVEILRALDRHQVLVRARSVPMTSLTMASQGTPEPPAAP